MKIVYTPIHGTGMMLIPRALKMWGFENVFTVVFLAIPVALLILFTIIPAVNMIIFSFQQRDQLGVNVQWGGFDNYKDVYKRQPITFIYTSYPPKL